MKKPAKEMIVWTGITLAFFLLFFSFTGLRFIAGFIIIFIIPIYLLLGLFKLDLLERAVYSLFLGIGIVSTLVYYLGLVISFRISIAAVFIALMLLWLFLKKRKSI